MMVAIVVVLVAVWPADSLAFQVDKDSLDNQGLVDLY